jgi:hypothetical protein
MRIVHLVLLVILTQISTFAQDVTALLGEPFNAQRTQTFINSLDEEHAESFLPYLRTYKLDYFTSGVSIDLNSDLAVYRVSLFDSGYAFKAFNGSLPLGVQWHQTESAIENEIGNLEEVRSNQFVKQYTTEDYVLDFYFLDGRLYLMRCTVTPKKLKENAQNIFKAWGIRLLPDGKPVKGNVLDSIGTMVWGENAAIYEGEWSFGLPHGKGQYVDSFGNKYDGEFKLGFFWGKGDFYSAQQNFSYRGDFIMGKKHGNGKIAYTNKIAYAGDWFQDIMQGTGTYVMGTNYFYEGAMRNNNFNGKGKLTTPDGTIDGSFKNGKPHGYCVQKTSDGFQELKGRWVNGKKEGEFTLVVNGNESKHLYKNDVEVDFTETQN